MSVINRQAAIDALNSERVEEDGIHFWRGERNETIDVAVGIIQALPSADTESEIITCKDCMFRREEPINDDRYWCEIHNKFMYYCSDAERRSEWVN